MAANPITYPVHVEGHLDPELSRWQWLLKWLFVLPHYIVLAFLWIAFVVLSVVAFFGILFTGRYPRRIFDFNVGVLRWTWRVGFYAFAANGTDRYPPFTLANADYPATFSVEYPERLSRGLVLVKWWLLAIPHYIVVGFFAGAGTWLVWSEGDTAFRYGGGLIGVLVLIAAIVLLFTGSYPRSIFDFVLGMNRWVLRVAAYAGLMTDRYPPFRLDMGGDDPAAVEVEPPTATPAAGTAQAGGWTVGRVLLLVFGSIAALVAAGLLAGGTAVTVVDQTQRDEAGFLMSPTREFASGTYAIVSETIDLRVDGPDWIYSDALFGTVKLESRSAEPVFLGIASAADVARYLGDVPRDVVQDFSESTTDYRFRAGSGVPADPAAQDFWVASATGAGEQSLRWEVQDGRWQIVAMNADGSRGVQDDLAIGAELPNLIWVGVGLLVAGALLLAVGGLLIYLGARSRPAAPAAEA
jgi:Domain of unknown function (DUF4389)